MGMIWSYLAHLSFNMWEEADAPPIPKDIHPVTEWHLKTRRARPELRWDEVVWQDTVDAMVAAGVNQVILDLGDGVKYESHPEIAVKKAWTPKRLRRELKKLRVKGIEVIPKLNFSACHDAWLGPYARCLSTELYYRVCADLIAEVCDLFDGPRFFQLGMDEETASQQRFSAYTTIRHGDLWWHDLYFLFDQCERANTRPWVWSDACWRQPEIFLRKMPKHVLQSNWFYMDRLDKRNVRVRTYLDLDAHGYDQVPTGSNVHSDVNFAATVAYCRKRLDPGRLLGFMQAPWTPTEKPYRAKAISALKQIGTCVSGQETMNR
jgi:predicted nuclease with RNAse H fold